MAFSKSFKEKVITQLSKIGPVSVKDMFGGVGIYFEGYFLAVIVEDVLYFKTDETNVTDYKNADMKNWEISKAYYEVPKNVFENIEELKVWVDKSVGVVERRKRKKK